jgi:hypothetical protein
MQTEGFATASEKQRNGNENREELCCKEKKNSRHIDEYLSCTRLNTQKNTLKKCGKKIATTKKEKNHQIESSRNVPAPPWLR